MKHNEGRLFFLLFTLVIGCTDRREVASVPPLKLHSNLPPATSVAVAGVQFQNADTTFVTMAAHNGQIYTSGFPFGMAIIDYASNPEAPRLISAVADQIDTAFPIGTWGVDWYASGAIAVLGNFVYTSGTVGLSAFNVSNVMAPVEVSRYPLPQNGQPVRDEAFLYRAIVANPNPVPGLGTVMYGFDQENYVYTIRAQNQNLSLIAKASYGAQNQPVCCVQSATVYNNVIFVAFGSALWAFPLASDGSIGAGQRFPEMQAVNVASSPNFLYVQHSSNYGFQPGPGQQRYPSGIYVFNSAGQNVAFMDITPKTFVVSESDSHLFDNEDDTEMKVYRMQWATGQ
jgi:hypothetical protein